MSLEALEEHLRQGQEKIPLSLHIPRDDNSQPSSSAASSEPASPNPLTDSDTLTPLNEPSETPPSSTSTHASGSSLALAGPSLSVKFAPLPDLGPRKRRSTTPLGMAARGQLMRKRKSQFLQQQQVAIEQDATAGWTPQEREEHRLRQEELAARYAHYQASAAALAAREDEAQLEEEEEELERHAKVEQLKLVKLKSGDDGDVPFLAIGKSVKGFWKRVGRSKDLESGSLVKTEEEPAEGGGIIRRRKSDIGRRPRTSSSPIPPPVPRLPPRPILASITSNTEPTSLPEVQVQQEGGVWEEEIGNSFPMNVSQTETIVEGRAIYATVKAVTPLTVDTSSKATKGDGKLVKALKNPPVKSKTINGKS